MACDVLLGAVFELGEGGLQEWSGAGDDGGITSKDVGGGGGEKPSPSFSLLHANYTKGFSDIPHFSSLWNMSYDFIVGSIHRDRSVNSI